MSDVLPGPHHCIGATRMMAAAVFDKLHSLCRAKGGTLTVTELEDAERRFLASLPRHFDVHQRIYDRCMSAETDPFSRVFSRPNILGFVLCAATHEAATSAFALQVNRFRPKWTREFYRAFGAFVRAHLCPTADDDLLAIYAVVSREKGAELTVADFRDHPGTSAFLRRAFDALLTPELRASMSRLFCEEINKAIAPKEHMVGANLKKITIAQVETFLSRLERSVYAVEPAGMIGSRAP